MAGGRRPLLSALTKLREVEPLYALCYKRGHLAYTRVLLSAIADSDVSI